MAKYIIMVINEDEERLFAQETDGGVFQAIQDVATHYPFPLDSAVQLHAKKAD